MDIELYDVEDFVCDETFQQYCLGSKAQSIVFWTRWLQDHPDKAELIDQARKLVMILSAGQGNKMDQLKQLRQGIQQQEAFKSTLGMLQPAAAALPGINVKRHRVVKLITYVSGIAALFAVVFLFYYRSTGRHGLALLQNSKPLLFNSGNLQRKTIVLEDGTVVTLRQNSSLQLSDNYNEAVRDVRLVGEAFFDVKHNAARPFIVHTRFSNIKVLGTVFNVKAYPGSGFTETALFRGKVQVDLLQGSKRRFILTPNQKLLAQPANPSPTKLNESTPVYVIQPIKSTLASHHADELTWTRNRLQIDNESLEQIALKLQNWYGIKIVFADNEAKYYHYSGTFESENILKALEALQLSYSFDFKVEQDKIIISK